jgi:hypothetical protein
MSLRYVANHYSGYHSGATAPSWPRPPHCRGFTITLRHTTPGRTPLDEWSARCRDLYLTAPKHSEETNICADGGIRARNARKRAAADPRPFIQYSRLSPATRRTLLPSSSGWKCSGSLNSGVWWEWHCVFARLFSDVSQVRNAFNLKTRRSSSAARLRNVMYSLALHSSSSHYSSSPCCKCLPRPELITAAVTSSANCSFCIVWTKALKLKDGVWLEGLRKPMESHGSWSAGK